MDMEQNLKNTDASAVPTILLVDDDIGFLRLLAMRLESSGYNIITAQNGKEALNKLTIFKPDLLITDLKMDEMNGFELFSATRSISSCLPVILITAHGSIPEAVAATQQGICSFITKPIDKNLLLNEINKALETSGFFKSNGAHTENEWSKEILTRNPAMNELLSKAGLVAESDIGVMLIGEAGTGKRLLAKGIHKASSRRYRKFISINCSSLSEQFLEAELFGHEKGAFHGAIYSRQGALQEADGGTVFLDEISELPLSIQVKLLRAIQEKRVRPVGSFASVPFNARIISASDVNLEELIANKVFREDLYYQLNVVHLNLPPLRDRREDIPVLSNYFLKKIAQKQSIVASSFAPQTMELFINADWPGNVQQLRSVVEQLAALTTTSIIPPAIVEEAIDLKTENVQSFSEARREFERDFLIRLLKLSEGNVTKAAKKAKRNRTDFYKLLNRHKIEPALFKKQAACAKS